RLIRLGGIVFLQYEIRAGPFEKDPYEVRAVSVVIDDQNPSFSFGCSAGDRIHGGESAPEASGQESAINFYVIHQCRLVMGCHALSQVTNHAPIRPRSTPSSGLDTANQNGITSLN